MNKFILFVAFVCCVAAEEPVPVPDAPVPVDDGYGNYGSGYGTGAYGATPAAYVNPAYPAAPAPAVPYGTWPGAYNGHLPYSPYNYGAGYPGYMNHRGYPHVPYANAPLAHPGFLNGAPYAHPDRPLGPVPPVPGAPVPPVAPVAPVAPLGGLPPTNVPRPVYDYEGPPKPFAFGYVVKDEFGNDYSHESQSDGVSRTGSYRTLLPDGRMQIVTYVADEAGFRADVQYEFVGEAAFANPLAGGPMNPLAGGPGLPGHLGHPAYAHPLAGGPLHPGYQTPVGPAGVLPPPRPHPASPLKPRIPPAVVAGPAKY